MLPKFFQTRIILISAFALFFISCAGLQIDLSKYAPEIKLKNIELDNYDIAGVDLAFTYEIKNKINFEIIFSTLDFEIFADDHKIFNGKNKKNVVLKPLGTSQFTLTHRVEYNQIDSNLERIYNKDEVEVKLIGKVGIYLKWIKQSLTVPIKGRKMTPVPHLPKVAFVDFRHISSNLATLKPYAKFELKLNIKNTNKFEVGVEKVSYLFTAGKMRLATGKTSPLQIPPNKWRTVTIPVTFQGKDALAYAPQLLNQKLNYNLSGMITMKLAGRSFDIPYTYP